MRQRKHLSLKDFPSADIEAFRAAYAPGDLFDDTHGPGAHLAPGMRRMIMTGYRRWLGFLQASHPHDLALPPADSITPERVKGYVRHLSKEMRSVSVAICIEGLRYAGRFADSARDWRWLASIAGRLRARELPEDRFDRLIPGWCTLDDGLRLMDHALMLTADHRKKRERQYRDGLLIAMLSLWPIRRRSLAALTVSEHVEFDEGGANILLRPEDTKGKGLRAVGWMRACSLTSSAICAKFDLGSRGVQTMTAFGRPAKAAR